MLLTLLAVVHVIIGILLIVFVLLQDPKGGAMGVFSGGSSSNSFFGSSGASNFLTATTKWLAIGFAATCLTLTYITANKGSSVMDNVTLPPAAPAATESAVPAIPPAETKADPGSPAATKSEEAPKK